MQQTSTVRIHPFFLNFKRPSDHSLFSPSAGERWLDEGCSFSVNFCKDIPREDSKYSAEGTLAHLLGEALFRYQFYGLSVPAQLMAKLALLEDLGAEMMSCCNQYVDVISFWLNNHDVIGDVIFFGQEVGVPVFPDESCFGTADFLIVGTKASVIIDLKYGKGKKVKPDTVQLKIYAAGLARFLENVPQDYPIHVVIHQPRIDPHPQEHSYSIAELYEFLGVIWNSIQRTKQPNLQPHEGNHCFWCPAKRTKDPSKKCPAMLDRELKVCEENFAGFFADMNAPVPHVNAPNTKRYQALLKLHALYPMIKQVVETTSEEIMLALQSGQYIEGFYIKSEEGRREINGATVDEKAQLLTSKFPQLNPYVEVPATRKLKTLSEIEKEIGKNKLDVVCTKKITKKVAVEDAKTQTLLGDMVKYAQMINNGQGQEE